MGEIRLNKKIYYILSIESQQTLPIYRWTQKRVTFTFVDVLKILKFTQNTIERICW